MLENIDVDTGTNNTNILSPLERYAIVGLHTVAIFMVMSGVVFVIFFILTLMSALNGLVLASIVSAVGLELMALGLKRRKPNCVWLGLACAGPLAWAFVVNFLFSIQ